MTKKIYNGFIFFNEIELLLLRLRELSEVVDYFIVCESSVDFRGKPKLLYFDENKDTFKEYTDKIIHVIVEDMPISRDLTTKQDLAEHEPAIWKMEYFQRDAIRRGLINANPEDVIIISDADEIPSKSAIRYLQENRGYFQIDMSMFQFYLNMEACESGWGSVFAYSYFLSDLIQDFNLVRRNSSEFFEEFEEPKHRIDSGGWHFTFLGGQERVQQKLAAYSHTDSWARRMWDADLLQKQMTELLSVGGGQVLTYRPIDETFPDVVQLYVNEYTRAGFIKTAEKRIAEFEALWNLVAGIERESKLLKMKNSNKDKTISRLRNALSTICEIASKSSNNLIPGSRTFSENWFPGVQSQKSCLTLATEGVNVLVPNNAVMVHYRDDRSITYDNNCGYWTIPAVEAGVFYTVSCWINFHNDFRGFVKLSIGEWQEQIHRELEIKKVSGWRRVSATAKSPSGVGPCNAVIRIESETASKLYSTCWQIELGDIATEYQPTEIFNV